MALVQAWAIAPNGDGGPTRQLGKTGKSVPPLVGSVKILLTRGDLASRTWPSGHGRSNSAVDGVISQNRKKNEELQSRERLFVAISFVKLFLRRLFLGINENQ
jgi:hypothetical protein